MSRSIIGKKSYTVIAAMVFASVCIGAILLWRYMSGYEKLTQSQAMIFLNSSVIVPADKSIDAATGKHENNQISVVPEPAPLNNVIKESLSQWCTVSMRVTAYCPCSVCCGRFAKGQTANGYVIKCVDHFVAAPKKYPFGTEIVVPQYNGDKPIKVLDRGGAIKGNCLDVFFPSHVQAVNWGVKYLDVKVRAAPPN